MDPQKFQELIDQVAEWHWESFVMEHSDSRSPNPNKPRYLRIDRIKPRACSYNAEQPGPCDITARPLGQGPELIAYCRTCRCVIHDNRPHPVDPGTRSVNLYKKIKNNK
jgi:hypothetical protein